MRIHAELWHTSNCLLEAGQRSVERAAHQFRASLIFRAFYVEAFLNWLGPQLIPHWKYLERLRPKEKLDLLSDLIQVKPDFSSRPRQIVKDLFDFRNAIAHGKPENLEYEGYEELKYVLEPKIDFIKTDWENFGTESSAIRAKEDAEKIATILYEKANLNTKGRLGRSALGFRFAMHILNPASLHFRSRANSIAYSVSLSSETGLCDTPRREPECSNPDCHFLDANLAAFRATTGVNLQRGMNFRLRDAETVTVP